MSGTSLRLSLTFTLPPSTAHSPRRRVAPPRNLHVVTISGQCARFECPAGRRTCACPAAHCYSPCAPPATSGCFGVVLGKSNQRTPINTMCADPDHPKKPAQNSLTPRACVSTSGTQARGAQWRRPAGEIIDLVRRHRAGASASSLSWSICVFLAHGAYPHHAFLARVRLPAASGLTPTLMPLTG